MYKFTKAGTVRKISNSKEWEVCEPFYWWLNYETQDFRVIVEKGFKTDFGSVPACAWWLINPTGYNAFVLHDKMYSKRIKTRSIADKALLNALIVEGCPVWKAFIIYLGVRLGGVFYW